VRVKPFPLEKFTDEVVNAAYQTAGAALSTADGNDKRTALKASADTQRDSALARGPLLSAACTYLVLAQANMTVGSDDPEKLYHFAANAFRDLGLLQRAAECYFNASLAGYIRYSEKQQGNAAFARRSAGRAKAMFSDLGDDESSGDSHVLQQRLRQAELRHSKNYPIFILYWLWDRVSEFGTSPSRWLGSTLLVLVLFAILYATLIPLGAFVPATEVHRTGFALVTSSLVFSLGNLFQFGTLGTLTPATALGQFVAVAHGVVAFVLVGTGATFLTRS
jgi:hypothetical protein